MKLAKTRISEGVIVGALVLAFSAVAVIPAAAGPVFGNRSRDKQVTENKSSSSSRSSVSTDRSRATNTGTFGPRSRPSESGAASIDRSRPGNPAGSDIRSRPTGAATANRGSTSSSSIWDRLRNGNVSRPTPQSSEPARSSDIFRSRESARDNTRDNFRDSSRTNVRDNSRDNSRESNRANVRDNSRDRSTSNEVFRSREISDRSRSYSGTSDRSKLFERVNERPKPRLRYEPSHYVTYRNYYSGHYYRPYTGWRAPYSYSGVYYYSWPHRIEPCYFGHYVFSYVRDYSYPSVYFHFGYFPYLHRSRVIVINVPVVRYVDVVRVNYRFDDDYYLSAPSYGSIDRTLADVRRAWIRNDWDLFRDYVRPDERMHVYIDGRYSYSIDGVDYLDMTRDALERTDTIDIDFYSVKRSDCDRYIAYGTHTYYDIDGQKKCVYVSYTFERVRGEWVIVEVGSSKNRL